MCLTIFCILAVHLLSPVYPSITWVLWPYQRLSWVDIIKLICNRPGNIHPHLEYNFQLWDPCAVKVIHPFTCTVHLGYGLYVKAAIEQLKPTGTFITIYVYVAIYNVQYYSMIYLTARALCTKLYFPISVVIVTKYS